ncbi:MAG: acetylglutamate kinase [Candidatus Omnitrophica bacterium]|nr:acetylglutamate kinase [Candidatus Omnitrophota bacterium]
MDEFIRKADVLIEALPYIKEFRGKISVIKFGGSAMGDEKLVRGVIEDIVFMSYVGMKPVIVHGGGPMISARMKERGKVPHFVDGIRVTDEETIHIVDASLAEVNRSLVQQIEQLGGKAEGLHGRKADVVRVRKMAAREDIGYVGEITLVRPAPILKVLEAGRIPVISPMGIGNDNHLYNVNGDQVSSWTAARLEAHKLVLMTSVGGILKDEKDTKSLVSTLNTNQVKELMGSSVITGGMIPKANACLEALEKGVRKTHIISVNVPHALLLEIFTDKGIGTEIIKDRVHDK